MFIYGCRLCIGETLWTLTTHYGHIMDTQPEVWASSWSGFPNTLYLHHTAAASPNHWGLDPKPSDRGSRGMRGAPDTVNKGCGQWDWGRRAVSGEDVVLICSFRSDENHNLLNLFTSEIRCLQKGPPQRCRRYMRSTTSESANSTVRTHGEED